MNLNASGFARGIKSVIGSVKNMNESMKDATNSASKMSSVMKGIGSSAIKVGKGLAVAGAAAATAVTAWFQSLSVHLLIMNNLRAV